MKSFAIAAVVAAVVAAPVEASRFSDPYEQLAVLGDSLADPGNIFFGFPPFEGIGFPPPPYYRGQFSNGRNFAVSLQRSFEKAGKPTRNYAFGGAKAAPDDDVLPDLPLQAAFLLGDPLFTPTPNTLMLINFGGNDLLGSFRDPTLTQESVAVVVAEAVGSIGLAIQAIAGATGVTDFVLPNLGSVGAAPRVLFGFDPFYGPLIDGDFADAATLQFNEALSLLAAGLRFQGLNIIEVDVYSRLEEIIADPSIVGLDVDPFDVQGCGIPFFFSPDSPAIYNFDACIDDPANAQFLFFDDVHPVRQIHQELARLVRAEVQAANMAPVPLPGAAGMMLVALAGLYSLRAGRRRNQG